MDLLCGSSRWREARGEAGMVVRVTDVDLRYDILGDPGDGMACERGRYRLKID